MLTDDNIAERADAFRALVMARAVHFRTGRLLLLVGAGATGIPRPGDGDRPC